MRIVRWAAVAVTVLFVLMNLGAAVEAADTWVRIAGLVLGIGGAIAAGGLAMGRLWGARAVVGIGLLNVLGGILALVSHQEGGGIGVVVGGLGALLGVLAARSCPPCHSHGAVERQDAGRSSYVSDWQI